MTAGALLATAWNDSSLVRKRTLTVGGLDVVLRPRTTGNSYGSLLETVKVVQVADAGASSLAAVIEDPESLIVVDEAAEVRFHDCVNDRPIFRGILDHWAYLPRPGGQGRMIKLDAIGIEAWLDWAKVTAAIAFPAGLDFRAAVQSIVYQSTGLGDVAAIASSVAVAQMSQSAPIAALTAPTANTLTTTVLINAGTSVREAIRQVGQAVIQDVTTGHGASNGVVRVTIDEYGGLRAGRTSSDWAPLSITIGANPSPESINDETDASGVLRAVYIAGANAAGTGWVTDGTGKPGATAYVTDPNVDSADKRDNLGLQMLGDRVTTRRGSYELSDWTPGAQRAGGFTSLIGTSFPWGSGSQRIASIERTFEGSGRETWRLNYGSLRPSIATEVRRLTRDVLS